MSHDRSTPCEVLFVDVIIYQNPQTPSSFRIKGFCLPVSYRFLDFLVVSYADILGVSYS